ncbi:hypothetical protein RS3R2_42930 [Pseudomonas lactis]|nr:hypothetical protein RS3R2_42930 [Pseudomonas lactis]
METICRVIDREEGAAGMNTQSLAGGKASWHIPPPCRSEGRLPSIPVGAGLPAKAVCQSVNL